jgi:hypothetical protein
VTDSDDQQTHDELSAAVTMSAKELQRWLDTDQAQEVGPLMNWGHDPLT